MSDPGFNAPVVAFADFGDLAAFQKRLVEAVKGAFGSIIPEAVMAKVIEAEWKRFVSGLPETHDRFGNCSQKAREPEINELVRAELKKQVILKIEEWGKEWANGAECSELARKTIEQAACEAARVWQTNLGLGIVQQVMAVIPSVFACRNCGKAVHAGQSCPGCGHWQS